MEYISNALGVLIGVIGVLQVLKSFITTSIEKTLEPFYRRIIRKLTTEIFFMFLIFFYIFTIKRFDSKLTPYIALVSISLILIMNGILILSKSKKAILRKLPKRGIVKLSNLSYARKLLIAFITIALVIVTFFSLNNFTLLKMNEINQEIENKINPDTYYDLIFESKFVENNIDFSAGIKSGLLFIYIMVYFMGRFLMIEAISILLHDRYKLHFHVILTNGSKEDNLLFVSINDKMIFFENQDGQNVILMIAQIVDIRTTYGSKQLQEIWKTKKTIS